MIVNEIMLVAEYRELIEARHMIGSQFECLGFKRSRLDLLWCGYVRELLRSPILGQINCLGVFAFEWLFR